jgi:tetratricopeptide (TPR) repeat protein
MIEALKKRFKKGDTITLFTSDSSFTGKIEDFEETCIVLETEDNLEFIANSSIIRFSAPKFVLKETINSITEIVSNEKSIKEDKRDEIIKPITEYKVGEKIPLELLAKGADKKKRIPKVNTKPQKSFKSFEALGELITPEEKQKLEDDVKIENVKIVSANGVVTKYFLDRAFGFIIDKFGYDIYFDVRDVIDEDLIKLLKSTSTKLQIPVVFTLSENYKGDKAIFVQKPKEIEDILKQAEKSADSNDLNTAIGLIEQILFSYPENRSANKLKEQLKSKNKPKGFNSQKIKSNDLNYQKATKARLNRDFETALKYYNQAFSNNEKRESCIKDLAMMYIQMGEIQKAIDFVEGHKSELPKNITTYNYLVNNIYIKSTEYNKVIELIDLLLREKAVIRDERKRAMYLSQKGFALIQTNKKDEARKILKKSLELLPDNTYAHRLLQALDEPDLERQSQIIAEAEFDSFGGGLSKFIKETLDNYEEYSGLRAKVIESGNFTKESLREIRQYIETAGTARPRERAKFLLTEAKLMLLFEPEKENNLRAVLARYCNAMALNHISENSQMDVIRNYYIEAFSLNEKYDAIINHVAIYLKSFISSYGELLNLQSVNIPIENVLKDIFSGEIREVLWDGMLSVFLYNRGIAAQLIGKLYENADYRTKSCLFLNNLANNIPQDRISKDNYIIFWNDAIDKRRRDYTRWLSTVKAIYINDNLDIIVYQLKDSVSDLRKNWLTSLDTSRLSIITTDIVDLLSQYLKQSGYRDKERLYGNAKMQVNLLISEFKEQPTKLSYEGFIPLLDKVMLSLDNSFKAIEKASIPIVKVSVLGEEGSVVNQENKSVSIKIQVENSKNSSPIRDIYVHIKDSDDVKSKNKAEYFDSVDGGEHCELHIKAELSDKVIQDKATTITVVCTYKQRNQEEPIIKEEELSLRLYSEEEFETIPNPYERLANGGPVTDTKMFYGRNEFIARITDAIIQTDSKQVVIYGQKRSGKSSVLYHLQKSLELTNQTFCVSFSIGNIFENISTETFFYKIIDLIAEELDNYDSNESPDFKCPSFSEFKEVPNPADFFRKQIRLFKKACSTLDEWKERKLVIMIDEFTYLYTAIKQRKISDGFMKQWKAITQDEDSMFSSVLVGQDVFPMFKDEFPNEFGITQDERLTYLSKNDTVKLIEEPIGKTKSGRNRFIGDALDTIIDYTSCNPYYIQIFCARLVSEMNRKKYIEVTSADVKEIADSFINGGQALTDDKFDNLLNAGEEHDIQKYKQEISKELLKNIAINAKNIGFCLREQISISNKDVDIDEVLKDLVKREVLEQKNDSYKIQVKLFQEWLLKH